MNNGASQSSSSISPSLIERARDHEPEAWQRFTQIYTPLVKAWVRQAGLQSTDAADVGVQKVFRSVAGKLDSFRMDEPDASFRVWLWTIARNEVRLHYRRPGNRPNPAGRTAADNLLQQQPDSLDHEQELSGFDSHIAEDLGMNPAAVRQAKYGELCRLREELESC